MAGRPLRTAMLDALEALGLAKGYTGPRDDVALAATLDWLQGDHPPQCLPSLASLALYLDHQGARCSRPMLSNWVNDPYPIGTDPTSPFYPATTTHLTVGGEGWPTRRAAYERVKPQQAGALVDSGMQVLEDAKPHEHGIAKARASYRQWMAERLDRGSWGQAGPAPQVAIGSLHLHAVQRPPTPQVQIAPPPQGTGMGSGNGEYPTGRSIGSGEVGGSGGEWVQVPGGEIVVEAPRGEGQEG